ncbi:hypothetical protein Taro_006697 [Colocasia esculenta]|uniref:Uncharacterized protein n=1 Tax=Colocasia esculenta TaxID=4460 RepID=A0A843TW23_COLES|nr:hypothetical protein [Colocasia esculenta]
MLTMLTGIAMWLLSCRADPLCLGGHRSKTEAAPHFPLSPFLYFFFPLLPLSSPLAIYGRFFMLVVLVLRWCHPVRAGDVLVLLGARRRCSFLREGPNRSALLVEVVPGRTAPVPSSAKDATAIEVAMMSRMSQPTWPPQHHRDALVRRDKVTTAWAAATRLLLLPGTPIPVRLLREYSMRRACSSHRLCSGGENGGKSVLLLTTSLFVAPEPPSEAKHGIVVRPDYGGYCLAGRALGGGDGEVVVVPVASSGFPFSVYVTLGVCP